MNRGRRALLKTMMAAGVAAVSPLPKTGAGVFSAGVSGGPGEGKDSRPPLAGKYRLRYAPVLDFLAKELTIPQRLELFASHGFDATEYNGLMRHSLQEVAEIRSVLDRLKMEMGIFVANPGGWKTAGLVNIKQREAFLGEITRAIEYHRAIGNRFCTVITGPEVQGLPRGVQRRNVIEGLKRAADLLEPTELTIVVEPLNPIDHPDYFVRLSDELVEMIASVNSSHVRMLFDLYHLQITEGNLINNLRNHFDYIAYFQIGDVPGRKEPGTGEINYRNVFKAIYEKGYRGILGMEHGLSTPGEAGLLKAFDEYRNADSW